MLLQRTRDNDCAWRRSAIKCTVVALILSTWQIGIVENKLDVRLIHVY